MHSVGLVSALGSSRRERMKSLSVALIVVISASSRVATAEDRDKFVGTWALDAIEVRDQSGTW